MYSWVRVVLWKLLCLFPIPTPPTLLQLAKQKRCSRALCCKAEPGHGLRRGVDYQQQEERDTDLWNMCIFSPPLFENHQPHLACKGGICSTKTENIQCSRVGVGLDTRIFTVNALHWCRSFIQLHLQLIWLTLEGQWPLHQRTPLSASTHQVPSKK